MNDKEQHQKDYSEKEHSEREAFDKGILLLNTGAIGASFLLLNAVAVKLVPDSKDFLFWSWCSFGCSALSTVTSHYVSAVTFKLDLTEVENERIRQKVENLMIKKGLKDKSVESFWPHLWSKFDAFVISFKRNALVSLLIWLNRASLYLFIIGAALLLWFGKINLENL